MQEVLNAEGFKPALTTLFIASTAEFDATLQLQVRQLSDKRVAENKFSVALIHWEEIAEALAINPKVFKSFYPTVVLPDFRDHDRDQLLAALELSYYGPFLWKYIELTFGEIGQMAGTNSDTVAVVARIVEARAAQVLPPQDTETISACLRRIQEICYGTGQTREDWDDAENLAQSISLRIGAASSLFTGKVAGVLETGAVLGRIYHFADDMPDGGTVLDMRRRMRMLLPEASQPFVDEAFLKASASRSAYGWADKVYVCFQRELRWSEA